MLKVYTFEHPVNLKEMMPIIKLYFHHINCRESFTLRVTYQCRSLNVDLQLITSFNQRFHLLASQIFIYMCVAKDILVKSKYLTKHLIEAM